MSWELSLWGTREFDPHVSQIRSALASIKQGVSEGWEASYDAANVAG